MLDEIGDVLSFARVEVWGTVFIGSGAMDHTRPMRDVVVQVPVGGIPRELRGYDKIGADGRHWHGAAGRIFFVHTTEEMRRWQAAANAVRTLWLSGVNVPRAMRVALYKNIVDGAPPVRV